MGLFDDTRLSWVRVRRNQVTNSKHGKIHPVIIMIVVGFASIVLWETAKTFPSNAYAQRPTNQDQLNVLDAGRLQSMMVAEQKSTNKKLDKLLTLLTSGNVKVKLVLKDKPATSRVRPGRVK